MQTDDSSRLTPVRAGGETLSVARLGGGPVLVALHGGPGLDHRSLLPLARALAERFEVWLPDLPGHGASGPAEGPPPDLAETTGRVRRWLTALDPSADLLVGHSLGAWIARECLRPGGARPRRAVLLCPPGEGTLLAPPFRIPRPRAAPDRRSADASERKRALASFEAHLDLETRGVPLETLREFARGAAPQPPGRFAALLRQLDEARRRPPREIAPDCPVLVLCGEEDRTTPPSQGAGVSRATRGSRLRVLPGLGHYPFLEDPDLVARAIDEFARLP